MNWTRRALTAVAPLVLVACSSTPEPAPPVASPGPVTLKVVEGVFREVESQARELARGGHVEALARREGRLLLRIDDLGLEETVAQREFAFDEPELRQALEGWAAGSETFALATPDERGSAAFLRGAFAVYRDTDPEGEPAPGVTSLRVELHVFEPGGGGIGARVERVFPRTFDVAQR